MGGFFRLYLVSQRLVQCVADDVEALRDDGNHHVVATKLHKIKTAEPILSDVSADIELCSESDRSMSHTTRSCDGRQEGCESGYYHLHRYLNNTIRLHNVHCSLFTVHYSLFSSVPSRHHRCCCYRPGSGYRHSP